MAAHHLLAENAVGRYIVFRVDNQAALRVLGGRRIASRMVRECSSTLDILSRKNQVALEWVPGHADVAGNERADVEAKRGASSPPIGPEPFVPAPDAFIRAQVKGFFEEKHRVAWWDEQRFRMTKEMVGWVDKAFPRSFISLDRESIRNLAQLITGHCTLEGHRWSCLLYTSPSPRDRG